MANSVTYNSVSRETNFTIDQGSTFEYTFSFTVSGEPFDLTGFDARMQVRRDFGSNTVLYEATVDNGRLEIVDAELGQLRITFEPDHTRFIRFDNPSDSTLECRYDLEIVDPSDRVYKPAAGSFTINREITR